MDTEAAALLVEAYLEAGDAVARRAFALLGPAQQAAAAGVPIQYAVDDLRRLSSDLGADADDVSWRRLWLLERDSIRIAGVALGWVPTRPLASTPTEQLLTGMDDPEALVELAVRSLSDPELASRAVAQLGADGLERILLDPGGVSESSLAVLLAAASRSEAGLNQDVLEFLLPTDSTHAARRIALFGRLLGQAQFSDPVTTAAAVWATDPTHQPHIGLAMTKYGTNFAAAALGAVAATGASAALFLTSPDASRSLSAISTPEAAFEIQVEGDEATASLIDAVVEAATAGTMTPHQSFEVWESMRQHLERTPLPGAQSRLALAELTNLHWDEIRLLSTDSTIPVFSELARDDVALATVSLELGARSVPLIAEAADDMYGGGNIAVHVEALASTYQHLFEGIHAYDAGDSAGGLVASALDTAISAAAVPGGPAVAWVAKSAGRELVSHVIVADHPKNIGTPREMFEHEFSPSNTAVPGGLYPTVSAFELQVLNQVLIVDPDLANDLGEGPWFDGSQVIPPDAPSDEFAEWFARATSGRTDVARSYHALRSDFADKVLLEALKVESK